MTDFKIEYLNTLSDDITEKIHHGHIIDETSQVPNSSRRESKNGNKSRIPMGTLWVHFPKKPVIYGHVLGTSGDNQRL